MLVQQILDGLAGLLDAPAQNFHPLTPGFEFLHGGVVENYAAPVQECEKLVDTVYGIQTVIDIEGCFSPALDLLHDHFQHGCCVSVSLLSPLSLLFIPSRLFFHWSSVPSTLQPCAIA